MNLSRPEANGPFIVYDILGFPGAKQGTEVMRAFYILLKIDPRFADMDAHTHWYTAHTVGAAVHFKVPAWPFPLYPSPANEHSDTYWQQLVAQVPNYVAKQMIHVHSVFDGGVSEGASEVEARKWRSYVLDFSRVKGVGHLSSQAVYEEALNKDNKDMLDFDYISIPIDPNDLSKGTDVFLGFKVGVVPPDGDGSRKVNRTGQAKSKLALKKEAAEAARAEAARAAKAGGKN